MSPSLFRPDETRQWLRFAEEDFTAAQILITGHPPLLKVALFHCQQAVEKAMKAFLVWCEQPFRKTHNLVPLSDQCVKLDPTLEEILGSAVRLNQFAVRFRYPGELYEPTVEETKQWLEVARSAVTAIAQRLSEEVRNQ